MSEIIANGYHRVVLDLEGWDDAARVPQFTLVLGPAAARVVAAALIRYDKKKDIPDDILVAARQLRRYSYETKEERNRIWAEATGCGTTRTGGAT